MQRDARPIGLSDVLHDVDLAGGGPVTGTEGPERGPEPGTGGELHARRGCAVRELQLAARIEMPGHEIETSAVVGGISRTVQPLDHERAVRGSRGVRAAVDIDRLGRIDVRLELVIHRRAANLDVPLRAVERRCGEVVEEDDLAVACGRLRAGRVPRRAARGAEHG